MRDGDDGDDGRIGGDADALLADVPEAYRPFVRFMLPAIQVLVEQAGNFDHRQPSTTLRRFEATLVGAFQKAVVM